jgi:phage-related tail fiber protein
MVRKIMNGLDLQGQKITGLADGSAATDAVTFQQFQAGIRGLDWKDSVRAATTGNITLSATQTVDGVALAVNDRVLVKDQTTASANGIYVVQAGAWVRAADADVSAEVTSGMAVSVEEGTTNGDKAFILTTNNPITLNTTALSFSVLGGGGATYSAGNGITLTGSTFSVNAAAGGGISVAAGGVSVDTAVVVRKYAVNIGTGAATSIAVNHALGTRDVTVAVYDNTTWEEVLPDVIHTDANNVTITFAVAPASNAYRVVVHA